MSDSDRSTVSRRASLQTGGLAALPIGLLGTTITTSGLASAVILPLDPAAAAVSAAWLVDIHRDEALAAHLPGLAPTLRLLFEHI